MVTYCVRQDWISLRYTLWTELYYLNVPKVEHKFEELSLGN